MDTFLIGNMVEVRAEFAALDGTPADPTTVTLTVRAPGNGNGNGLTLYTFGQDQTIVRDSAGLYRANLASTAPGVWLYRWSGAGAIVAAAEDSYYVNASLLDNPPIQ